MAIRYTLCESVHLVCEFHLSLFFFAEAFKDQWCHYCLFLLLFHIFLEENKRVTIQTTVWRFPVTNSFSGFSFKHCTYIYGPFWVNFLQLILWMMLNKDPGFLFCFFFWHVYKFHQLVLKRTSFPHGNQLMIHV